MSYAKQVYQEVQHFIYCLQELEMVQSKKKAITQQNKVTRKPIMQCGTKERQDVSTVSQTEHTAALGRKTKVLCRRIFGFAGSEVTAFAGPCPQAITGPAKHVPGFREETLFLLHLLGSWEKSFWIILTQNTGGFNQRRKTHFNCMASYQRLGFQIQQMGTINQTE